MPMSIYSKQEATQTVLKEAATVGELRRDLAAFPDDLPLSSSVAPAWSDIGLPSERLVILDSEDLDEADEDADEEEDDDIDDDNDFEDEDDFDDEDDDDDFDDFDDDDSDDDEDDDFDDED